MKHEELTQKIIGIFYDVYNELGGWFLESVYEEAMMMALRDSGIKAENQVSLPVWFRGKKIGDFKADIVVENKVLLELKAARRIDPAHEAQTIHYLKSTDIEVALLLNFGPRAEFRRLLLDNDRKNSQKAFGKSV
jgi:GxxExxY protein